MRSEEAIDPVTISKMNEIAGSMTPMEREVFMKNNFTDSYTVAPKINGRRSGAILKKIAIKYDLFEFRYEKANGLYWFKPKPLAHALFQSMRRTEQ